MKLAFAQQTLNSTWDLKHLKWLISKVFGTLSLSESVLVKLGQMCMSRDFWHCNAFESESYWETIAYSLMRFSPSYLFHKLRAVNHFLIESKDAWV